VKTKQFKVLVNTAADRIFLLSITQCQTMADQMFVNKTNLVW